MNLRLTALALPVIIGLACAEQPTAPSAGPTQSPITAQLTDGTGLVLHSVTGLSVPLIGQVGEVTIDQAVITNFAVVQNILGQVVGLRAEGVLQLTGGVLGTDVVTEDFLTTVGVTSSSTGQCGIVTIDLGPIDVSALGAQVNVPAASVNVSGSGALGSLLCALGQRLNPITQGVRSIVQAINGLI